MYVAFRLQCLLLCHPSSGNPRRSHFESSTCCETEKDGVITCDRSYRYVYLYNHRGCSQCCAEVLHCHTAAEEKYRGLPIHPSIHPSIHPLLAVSVWPEVVIHRPTLFGCSKTLEIIYQIFWKPKSHRLAYPHISRLFFFLFFFLTLQFFLALSIILSLMFSYKCFLLLFYFVHFNMTNNRYHWNINCIKLRLPAL